MTRAHEEQRAYDGETQTLISGITTWVECESHWNDPSGLLSMAKLVEAHARSLGLSVYRTELGCKTGPALTLSNRDEGDMSAGIMIVGHYDTVHPIGSLAANPVRVEGDRLYGPGSYDMKAGLYIAITALGRLATAGGTRVPVDIIVVPDEEIGSPHSRGFTESHAAGRALLCLVCEPARPNGGRCVTSRKGIGLIGVKAHGRSAHAGMAHKKGRNAIRELAQKVLELEAMTDYGSGLTLNVGTIKGGTGPNVVPESCEALVDCRIPSLAAWNELKARIMALAPLSPDVSIDFDFQLNRGPMERTEGSERLLDVAQTSALASGFALAEAPLTGGASDGNFVAALGVPTLDGLGAEGDGAHTPNEFVFIDRLVPRLRFWSHLIGSL